MNNIRIYISYSLKNEINRVAVTIQKIDWLTEHGYRYVLPKKFKSEKLADLKALTGRQIKKALSLEYRRNHYEKIASPLHKQWELYAPRIVAELKALNLTVPATYRLTLTKYGVGGSYTLPNKATLNINRKSAKRLCSTAVHELIHLATESFVKKYEIPHFEKERIIDLIFGKIFPQIAFEQNLSMKDIRRVDKVFSKNYPDIELIFRTLSRTPTRTRQPRARAM